MSKESIDQLKREIPDTMVFRRGTENSPARVEAYEEFLGKVREKRVVPRIPSEGNRGLDWSDELIG